MASLLPAEVSKVSRVKSIASYVNSNMATLIEKAPALQELIGTCLPIKQKPQTSAAAFGGQEAQPGFAKGSGSHAASSGSSLGVPVLLHSRQDVFDFLETSSIKSILLDCDGVVYRNGTEIPQASEAISFLTNELNKQVLFVTNSSGSSREKMRAKLCKVLDQDLGIDQMIPSCYSAACYLKVSLRSDSSCRRRSMHCARNLPGACQAPAKLPTRWFPLTRGNDFPPPPSHPSGEPPQRQKSVRCGRVRHYRGAGEGRGGMHRRPDEAWRAGGHERERC